MHLAKFVEEKQVTRTLSYSRSDQEHDVRNVAGMLIKEDSWSNMMEIPATGGGTTCQHVFVVRSQRQRGGELTTKASSGVVSAR